MNVEPSPGRMKMKNILAGHVKAVLSALLVVGRCRALRGIY
jgi:hypothetical protein